MTISARLPNNLELTEHEPSRLPGETPSQTRPAGHPPNLDLSNPDNCDISNPDPGGTGRQNR